MISLTASSFVKTNHFIQTRILTNPKISSQTSPRIYVRDKRGFDPLLGPDGKRKNDLVVIPQHLMGNEEKIAPIPIEQAIQITKSFSKIMPPSKTILVCKSELPTIADAETCFGTGELRFPNKMRIGKDRFREGDANIQTKKPGQGTFKDVIKGEYDIRAKKYLCTIDEEGVHIAREMDDCFSNRDIVSHVKLSQCATLGGEVWFLEEDGAVHVNLNSGRFPAKDGADLDAFAKFWLSLGYSKVYVTPLDQRYGEVTPILYVLDHSSYSSGGKLPNE